MRNFDEPDLTDDPTEHDESVRQLEARIIGDPESVLREFQGAMAHEAAQTVRRMAESFQLPAATAIKEAREAIANAAFANFKQPKLGDELTVRVPRIDYDAMVPKPVRPIADVRLEALLVAMNRLIDVVEKQTDLMESRHAESERHADTRADRADNRAAWGVTFAGLAALIVVIEFFFR